jgi:hypothetical protein
LFPTPILGTDVQPYALLLGIMMFVIHPKINVILNTYPLNFLIYPTLAAFMLGVASLIEYSTISVLRGLAGYFSLIIIPSIVLIYSPNNQIKSEKIFKAFVLIWFVVGLIQMFAYRYFLVDFVSGGRISSFVYRGYISLASEPSFFGVQCYYFLYIVKGFKKNRSLYTLICIISSVFIAQSMVGIIFVLSFFIQEFLDRKYFISKIRYLIVLLTLLVLSYLIIENFYTGTRIYQLIHSFIENGLSFINADESTRIRYNSITNALANFKDNWFLPTGFNKRIGSAWGGILNEIGFLGLIYMIVLPYIISLSYTKLIAKTLAFVFFLLLFFSNIQLANPMVGFVLGYILFQKSIGESTTKRIK